MAEPRDRPEQSAPVNKVPAKKAPAKKTPAKKVPAKKAVAKKAVAKKAVARKSAPRPVQPALKAAPPHAALTAGDSAARPAAENARVTGKPPESVAGDSGYRLPVSLGLAVAGLVALVLARLRRS